MRDESQLVEAARQGDAEAFGELVQGLDRRLFRVAQHILRHREDAEDAVQSACLKAFTHISTFRNESRFSTWLLRITVNESLGRLRSRSRDQAVLEDTDTYVGDVFEQRDIADWKMHPERLFARAELDRLLRKFLEELPLGQSMVFILRDVEQFNTAETAEALKLSAGNVKIRLLRARLQLREKLSAHFNAEPRRETRAMAARATAVAYSQG